MHAPHSGQAERQSRAGHRLLIVVIGTAGLLLAGASLLPRTPALIWNVSTSVPVGLYRLEKDQPERGDIAVIKPAGALARLLTQEGALPKDRLLLKPLAGLPGQTVCRTGPVVTLDDAPVAFARAHTHKGDALPVWSGCRRLSPDERIVLAQNPASFDSRYFGTIDANQIIGRACPVLVFPRPGTKP